ncbi:MAG: NAD(P)-dependent alcohol dehydrogenase [Armatimonadia bacterium]
MGEMMWAAVLHGVGDLRVEEVPRPELTDPCHAMVRVRSVGICGSDLHFYTEGRIGDFIVKEPLILGHEAAGEVIAVGEAVTSLQVGDRVAIEPGYPDRTCRLCKEGRYNLCESVTFLATPPVDGAFCEYLSWPADFLHRLPEALSLDEGAMIEPLSVGLHSVRIAAVSPGQSVAVFGAGPVGLATLQAALAAGATTAIVVDSVPSRLEAARSLGATHTLAAGAQNVAQIRDLTEGDGPHVTFECAGAIPALQAALRATRSGGHVQLVGMPSQTDPQIPVYEIIARELQVTGLFRYVNTYPAGIELVQARRVDVQALITHHFPLDEAPHALDCVEHNKDQVIKAVIHP